MSAIAEMQGVAEALYRMAKDRPKCNGNAQANGHAAIWEISVGGVDLDDDDLIEKARRAKNGAKFSALFDRGDIGDYQGDDSAADMALAMILAYWTGRDAAQIERLFSRSALGQRDKWRERADYRGWTIDKAVELCRTVYTPRRKKRAAKAKQAKPSANGDGQHAGPTPTPGLPEIVCGSTDPSEGLKSWTPQAIGALALQNEGTPRIFQRGGRLARLIPFDPGVSLQILGSDALRGELDRASAWAREIETKMGSKFIYGPPPIDIVRDVLALPGYDPGQFPVLDMIAESPRFLPDGSLVLAPGYHREGRLWYAPTPDLEEISVPERPTDADVAAAKELILGELLIDFPFANKASRANALAVTLLPFVRPLINGPTPNHHFTASTEGTGKGLCAAACAFPAIGREIDLNPQKESSAEWRKALTSAFMAGVSHFLIDNFENPKGWDDALLPVDSGVLAMAWTTRYWRDRILGGNTEARIKIETVFMSTGNNVIFSRELERRNVLIELLTPCENPSLRSGFRHDPLLDFARDNRRALTEACLTLCRRWVVEGMPNGSRTMGSYESYARTIGGILECCGVEGFLKNRAKKVASNPDSERWSALVKEWHRQHHERLTSTADLHLLILASSDLTALFEDTMGDGDARSQKTKLGRALEQRKGRIYADLRIMRAEGLTAAKAALWRLRSPVAMLDEDDADSGDEETGEEYVEEFDASRPY